MPNERDPGRTPARPPDALGLLAAETDPPLRHGPSRFRPTPLAVAGVASLANGAALLFFIIGRIPLPILLVFTWSMAVVALVAIGALGDPAVRARLRRYVAVGLVAGLAGTIAYDITKAILSQLDPSPFNPFEATRVFGTLLVGVDAQPTLIVVVGWAFHLVNGCTFAIAFACLFARGGHLSVRRAVVSGMAWGVFLETFQLALYPGWLNIKFLDEFRQISFLSHLVYGATVGVLVRAGLRRTDGRANSYERGMP
jgi:hypothetical protein